MHRVILMVLVVFVSVGCSTTTGIVKISEDTYMLAKQSGTAYTAGQVKVELYKEANVFCEKDGKKFVQLSNTGVDYGFTSYASAEIQFKCQ